MKQIFFSQIEARLAALNGMLPAEQNGTIRSMKFSFDGKTDCGFHGKTKFTLVKTLEKTLENTWICKSIDGLGHVFCDEICEIRHILNGLYSPVLEFHRI